MFYLTSHSTHFIYGYMASDIWLRTILIVRKETRCRHIGYSYRLTARVLLYAPSHRQANTYHDLCYTSRGALAGTRNSSILLNKTNDQTRPLTVISNIHCHASNIDGHSHELSTISFLFFFLVVSNPQCICEIVQSVTNKQFH